MQHRDRASQASLWLLAALALAHGATKVEAQVVPDGTLGNGNNSVTSTTGNRTNITGGLGRGSALFHSFQQFNISPNEQIYFANPANIRNIFSRVTGGSVSNIDGLLGVAGSANLFFMNPNGIIFGPNARLDVSGSFLATTANALAFPDGQKFAATGDRAVPLVEVNVPIGLQFGASPPAMLTNRGNLAAGKDLTLAAGNLDLQGQLQAGENLTLNATDTVKIRDTVTEPFVARSGGDMVIQGNQSIDILALNHIATPFQSAGDLALVSDGSIANDAHFYADRDFAIRTLSGEPGSFISLYDPIISANGDVTFANYTGPALKVEATGRIIITGNITITAPDTTLAQSASFGNFALGTGAIFGTLNNDVGSRSSASLENSLGLTSGALSGAPLSNGTATEGSAVTARFNAAAPGNLTFDWNFSTSESANSTYNDFSFYTLGTVGNSPTPGNLANTTSPLSGTPLSGYPRASTGTQTIPIATSGTYVLGLGVVDVRDTSVNSGLQISNLQFGGTPISAPSPDPDIQALTSSPALILRAGVATLLNAPTTFPATAGTLPTTFNATTPATTPATINVAGSINTSSMTASGGLVLLNAPGDITVTRGINSSSITGNGGNIDINSTSGNVTLGTARSVSNKIPDPINTSSRDGSGGNIKIQAAGIVALNNLDLLTDTNGSGRAGDITLTSSSNSPTAISLIDTTLSAGIGNSSSFLDTQIFLFDSITRNLLPGISSNDDSLTSQGGGGSLEVFPGSTLTRDSYLRYSFTTPGDYVIGVGGFPSSVVTTPPGTDQPLTGTRLSSGTYTLQVSIPDATVPGGRLPEILPKAEPNNAISTAQNINDSFAIGFNPNVENSDTIPYVSISGSGNNTYDYYRFTIPGSASAATPIEAIFDIDTGAGGIAGTINLTAPGGINLSNSQIDASTFGRGNSGDITVQTNAQLSLTNSSIRTTVGRNAEGNGGSINVNANQVNLTNGSGLDASNDGQGLGGSIQVTSNGVSLANNSGIRTTVGSTGTGNGGAIQVSTQTLNTTGGSRLEAQTLGTQTAGVGAQAGNITVVATGAVTFSGINDVGAPSGIFTSTEGANSGIGGNISVQADSLTVLDRAVLSARTNSAANGGNITINVNALDVLGGGQLITTATAASTANAGSITVTADQVQISGSATPFVAPVSPFDSVATANIIPLTGFNLCSVTSCDPMVNPNVANVEIPDRIPYLSTNATGNGEFVYYAFSVATAGSRGIFDIDNTAGTNDTQIFLFNRATGELVARNDDAPITAGAGGSTSSVNSYLRVNFPTSGEYLLGVARFYTPPADYDLPPFPRGPLTTGNPIPAGSTYTLQTSLQAQGIPAGLIPNQGLNSGLFAQAEGIGNAGNLVINTPQLTVGDDGRVIASTISGTSGNITIQGAGSGQVTLSNGAQISASTISGFGGDITLQGLNTLQINNGQVIASTQTGRAGSVNVNASGNIGLTNRSRIAVEADGANGVAGNVTVTGADISLVGGTGRSSISTSARGENASAGNVTLSAIGHSVTLQNSDVLASSEKGTSGNVSITARKIDLKNGTIKAETGQNTPESTTGSITLDASLWLTLEDESEISTLGRNRANGGDITIKNVRFLFGKPTTGPKGSDIVGRADDGGQGGKVVLGPSTLVAGFVFRKADKPNRTNDIDTNGQLQNFSTDADVASRGLSTPLIAFTDVSQLNKSACEAVGAKAAVNSELRITGQGGVTLSPTAPLPAQSTSSNWVSLDMSPERQTNVTFSNGATVTLQPGQTYQVQAMCVKSWKEQQRSLL